MGLESWSARTRGKEEGEKEKKRSICRTKKEKEREGGAIVLFEFSRSAESFPLFFWRENGRKEMGGRGDFHSGH